MPFRLGNQALGLLLLIPNGKEKMSSVCMFLTSLLAVLTALLLEGDFGVSGVAMGFLLAEVFLFIVFCFLGVFVPVFHAARKS